MRSAFAALGALAVMTPGAPAIRPEPPRIVVPASARIPGPKRKGPGHPFRTRPLKLDAQEDRERRFIEHVEAMGKKRRGVEMTAGQRFVAMQEFRRGSSAHRAYQSIRWSETT